MFFVSLTTGCEVTACEVPQAKISFKLGWAGWLVGRLVGGLVGWLVGWLVGCLVGWLFCCLVGCCFDLLVCWFVGL